VTVHDLTIFTLGFLAGAVTLAAIAFALWWRWASRWWAP
jgi:hypothetical protein